MASPVAGGSASEIAAAESGEAIAGIVSAEAAAAAASPRGPPHSGAEKHPRQEASATAPPISTRPTHFHQHGEQDEAADGERPREGIEAARAKLAGQERFR